MKLFALPYFVARKIFPLIFAAALLYAGPLAAGSAAVAQETRLPQVSFIPQWQPQAQFAGYYVAYEKGFYRERGLDVKILRGGPEWPPSRDAGPGPGRFRHHAAHGRHRAAGPGDQAGGYLPVGATFGSHAGGQEVQRHH